MTLLKELNTNTNDSSNEYDVYERYFKSFEQKSSQLSVTVDELLANLENGSVVCDVGGGGGGDRRGSGRDKGYEDQKCMNSFVCRLFYIGIDKCLRIPENINYSINEVLNCDKLALPFRDESFDVVLSIAVIHKLQTNEQILALRELSRILRIGGKLVVSVWALESKNQTKKFDIESIPFAWTKRPNSLLKPNTPINERFASPTASQNTKDNNKFPMYFFNFNLFHYLSLSRLRRTNSATTSLSSPSETCYGFVKKALQKLAGRKSKMSKQWSWASSFSQNSFIYKLTQSESNIDKDDENGEVVENGSRVCLDSNNNIEERDDDRTSIFDKLDFETIKNNRSKSMTNLSYYSNDIGIEHVAVVDETRERSQKLYYRELWQQTQQNCSRNESKTMSRVLVKSKSMNDELIDPKRLLERRELHKTLHKQMSFNEELIDAAHKKFMSFKNEFATKFKQQNLINLNRMSRSHIRSSFEKLLQNWKLYQSETADKSKIITKEADISIPGRNRRFSNCEDTDSCKDGSMFSESSMDSEESFISVIFIPSARKSANSPTNQQISPGSLKNGIQLQSSASVQNDTDNDKAFAENLMSLKQLPKNFLLFKQNCVSRSLNDVENVAKFYNLDLFNPALDDNESSSDSNSESSSSSNSSVKSVISVESFNERGKESEESKPDLSKEDEPKVIGLMESTNVVEAVEDPSIAALKTVSEEIEKHRKYLMTLDKLDEEENRLRNERIPSSENDGSESLKQSEELTSVGKTLLAGGNSLESSDAGYVSEKTLSLSESFKEEEEGEEGVEVESCTSHYSNHSLSASILTMTTSVGSLSKDFTVGSVSGTDVNEAPKPLGNANASAAKNSQKHAKNAAADVNSNERKLPTVERRDQISELTDSRRHRHARYYHLFAQGELDNLIDKHIDNLHIINSYYDQSSWCIVAEKVQVWTI